MSTLSIVAAVCLAAVAVALVSALLAMRRALARLETVLGMLEQELRPLVGEVRALTEDLRSLAREATRDVAEVGVVTERINAILGGVAGVATAVGNLTRAGGYVSLAMGLRKGVRAFVHRLREAQGDHHGE